MNQMLNAHLSQAMSWHWPHWLSSTRRHFLHLTWPQASTTSLSVEELEIWPQPGQALGPGMMTPPALVIILMSPSPLTGPDLTFTQILRPGQSPERGEIFEEKNSLQQKKGEWVTGNIFLFCKNIYQLTLTSYTNLYRQYKTERERAFLCLVNLSHATSLILILKITQPLYPVINAAKLSRLGSASVLLSSGRPGPRHSVLFKMAMREHAWQASI